MTTPDTKAKDLAIDNPALTAARHSRYVLVTPVKNEESLIPRTIQSVVAQQIGPLQWVIVSDGSTDRTNDIIRAAALRHAWISPVCLQPRSTRNFAAVVHATELGVKALTVSEYEFVGLLDSDVEFAPDYYARILEAFDSNPRLGLAGGRVVDVGRRRDEIPWNNEDVPGATQFFRRACFEALGGLIAIPEGGWDTLTCVRARMCGYQTRLLPDLVMDHLKPRNVSEGGPMRRQWQMGMRDSALGYHPVFELLKCVARMGEPPFCLGAAARAAGYVSNALRRGSPHVPTALKAYLRMEQRRRVLSTFRQLLSSPRRDAT